MIKVSDFYDELLKNDINFFTGVPDSLLKNICGYISDVTPKENHIIAANEGGAVGIGIGYNLATGKIPFIYMQNSGLGNSINPLLSLADPDVYSIPMILMVGWRGEPGVVDEPQHLKQGRINEELLRSMEIPFFELSPKSDYKDVLQKAIISSKQKSGPVAILVKKNAFEKYTFKKENEENISLSREEAITLIVKLMDKNDTIVSTTGKASRELFEHREKVRDKHNKDFLTVGGMGHANQIALGIALSKPNNNIYCFDGDGAIIMHTGSVGIIGSQEVKNFKHIVFNNSAHDSVGGQPTIGSQIDLQKIFLGFKYKKYFQANNKNDLKKIFIEFQQSNGPSILEVKICKGARADLGRPTITPKDNKKDFSKRMTKDN